MHTATVGVGSEASGALEDTATSVEETSSADVDALAVGVKVGTVIASAGSAAGTTDRIESETGNTGSASSRRSRTSQTWRGAESAGSVSGSVESFGTSGHASGLVQDSEVAHACSVDERSTTGTDFAADSVDGGLSWVKTPAALSG